MEKIFVFEQLTEEAKKVAAQGVYEIEVNKEQDWTHECQNITESIEYELEEAGLNYKEIYWEENYGISIDLKSVSISDDFLKKIFSEEQREQYNDLDELSGGYLEHPLYDSNHERDGYVMIFNYSNYGLEEVESMEFIMKYSDDEEVIAKYKFPLLMEIELSSEECSNLESDVVKIAESMAEELSEPVHNIVSALKEKLEKMVRSSIDYMGSEEYYYANLDAGCYEDEIYRFNSQGEVIMRDGDFVKDEYEDIYTDEYKEEEEEEEEEVEVAA